jgi:hypothetical protein
MTNNLGIFINNTDSELKFNINLNNFSKLKSNFDKIIVIDIETKYSINLKDKIIYDVNIYKYLLEDKFNKSMLNSDFEYNMIKHVLKDINPKYFNYITVISDNYIYCDNLKDYFDYVYEHNLDFYSFTDTTENGYNYQLYLFSFLSTSIYIEKIINYFDNHNNIDEITDNFALIFENKISFIKIAYIDNNYQNNVFMNDKVYQYLLENNIIPIININKLMNIKKNFSTIIFNTIPDNFDINIYKSHDDLKDYSDEFLYNHFLNYGQFEVRNYCNDNFIYPIYIRTKLEQCNLLMFFDIPTDFDVVNYKKLNSELVNFDRNKLMLHYVNTGYNENKPYKKTKKHD